MIKYLFHIILFPGLINNSWALPWFDHKNELNNNHIKSTTPDNLNNFSGVWAGQCDGSPAIELTIKHEQNRFSISYGFMEERYTLGEVKSQASFRQSASEHSSTIVNWNSDHSALIFINSNLFVNADVKTNVFFSEVSMFLKEGQLMVNGAHYHKDSVLDDFNHEHLSCIYQRK